MTRRSFHLPGFFLALTPVFAVADESKAPPQELVTYLNEHCYECHDDTVAKADLNLYDLAFDPTSDANFKIWQRVFERVRDDEMPPAKVEERPKEAEAQAFLASLRRPLMEVDQRDIAKNGRVRARRMTRLEYEHTVHDLLGIDVPLVDMLPEDPAMHGFETVAAAQQLSHFQLARYLDVADLALDEAFTRALKGDAGWKKFVTPKDTLYNRGGNYRGPELRDGESISWPITLQFFGRMSATTVPEDGWYRITLRDVRAVNPGKGGVVWGTLRSGECESNAPMLYMIGLVEATAQPRDLVFEAWIQKGHRLELKPNDGELRKAPTGAKGGNVSFKGRDLEKEGYSGIAHRGIGMERIHPVADSKTVGKNLFFGLGKEAVKKAPKAALNKMVASFAAKAFRRPASAEQLAPYLDIGRKSLEAGDPFPEALRASYRAILCSPRFLTFVEAPGPLDSHAIAARLSYALWTSMPDAQLTELADADKLRDAAVLSAQVDRMLADPKARRFVTSFTNQWLKLKEIDFTAPDPRQFKTFDTVLQESMLMETRAYFEEMIRKDLGVAALVDSDFAFVTERLARHYGIDAPVRPGAGLQKVALRPGDARGGFITQGAVLKVTADGTHTSPVVRGVFINERILGAHIPPPPPGVPAIEPDIRGAVSIRDQLDKHRNNESCASCHQTIDPPGFVLESFDPIGGWRTRYGNTGKGAQVDPSGLTPDGAAFADLEDWKKIYTSRTEGLARGFAGHFITYATGAAPRFSDESAMLQIVDESEENGFGLRSVIKACVTSPIFLTK